MKWFKKQFKYIILFGSIILGGLAIIASCGGGGGGNGGTETQGEGSDIIELKAVTGPIVGAMVWVSPIDDQDNLLAFGTTEDSDDLNEAGRVSLEVPEEYNQTPLYINVGGGVDIDANDDGVRDQTPTNNDITLEFAVPTPADLEGMTIVANPLLLYASRHVIRNVWGEAPNSVDDFSDPLTIRTLMKRVARALIKEDVDGDGTVDWQDIISFHPLTDQGKSRIPWGYVIDDIERLRQDHTTILGVEYHKPYFFDPMNQEPIDIIPDGNYTPGELGEYDYYGISFSTNKNDYTIQDLLDGQGIRGGRVILPDNQKMTYQWCDGFTSCYTEVDDYEPPLWIDPNIAREFSHLGLGANVGGFIFEPKEAPVGEYTIEYSTGDGQQHSDTLYLHENRAETYFSIIPTIQVDEEGFIDRIDLRFEDENGNELAEPSILSGEIMIFTWGTSVEDVNSLVRGEGYYVTIEGNISLTLYTQGISLLSPTAPHYPMNNGHKIYYEDADHIAVFFEAGDGVRRVVEMSPTYPKLFPQLGIWSIENGQVTVPFHPATVTNREVVSIRYKFDNTDWAEVAGDTLTVAIPNGATLLYVTAKDAAGFYLYAPYELDVTQ